MHRLPCNREVKEEAKACGEEGAGGNLSIFSQPERGGKWEKVIMRGKISMEVMEGVMLKLVVVNNDVVSFKKWVCLMMGQVELIRVMVEVHSMPFCDFPPVVDGFVIGEGKLTEVHEGKETSQKHGDEQEVIMVGGQGIEANNVPKVIKGESAFPSNGSAPHVLTASQGPLDKGGGACFSDIGKEELKLMSNS